tara:strand:+ start:422 stop:1498 length:1077 start_codon:yes stop_codon:yes gene_type:complete
MSDFQSRINSFRQGLSDQQSSFNNMATNIGSMGRSVLPDKVAQHIEYTEKIGGSITGVFAGLHGSKKVAQKVIKARKNRLARQNNQTPDDSGEKQITKQKVKATTQEEGEQQESDRAIQTQGDRQITESTRPESQVARVEDPTDIGVRDVVGREARGGKPAQIVKALDEEESNTPRPAPNKTAGTSQGETGPEPEQSLQDRIAALTNKKPITGEAQDVNIGATRNQGRGNLGPDSTEDEPFSQGSRILASESTEQSGNILSRGVGAVKDAVASGVKKVGSKIAGAVGEDVAGAMSDAIPVVGELVGLGMLIRGLVRAHRHEENAPPPKLTAATPEAMEQSGGFSSSMLKGPSMVGGLT